MSMKASDYCCVTLCSNCHTRGAGSYHRIGKRESEQSQGLSFAVVVVRLQREWRQMCAERVCRHLRADFLT
jgi:hypothetical protein